MDTLTERLERLAELQKKNIEPLQNLGSSAFVAFERMARKNYELMGDMVDYAVAQSRGSLEPSTPQGLYERQMAEARAFAERMSARTAEYVALAEQLRDGMAPGATTGVAARAGNAVRTTVGTASARDAAPDDAGVSARGDESAAVETATRKGSAASGTARGGASAGAAPKRAAAKKAAGKKAVAKKAGTKKAGSKKASGKKAGSKKTAGKRAASKKASGKRSATKKSGSRKASSR